MDIKKNQDKEEVLCNAIAAEILVPKDCFISKWNEIDDTSKSKIESLSKYFLVKSLLKVTENLLIQLIAANLTL